MALLWYCYKKNPVISQMFLKIPFLVSSLLFIISHCELLLLGPLLTNCHLTSFSTHCLISKCSVQSNHLCIIFSLFFRKKPAQEHLIVLVNQFATFFFSNYIFLSCNLFFFSYFKTFYFILDVLHLFSISMERPLGLLSSSLWATTDKPPGTEVTHGPTLCFEIL